MAYRGPSSWKWRLGMLAVLGGLGYGGWYLYQVKVIGERNASLTCSFRIDTKEADCYATFHRYPPQGDPRDVAVRLTGQTLLDRELVYDWNYLAPQDRRQGPQLSAWDPPPLGRELRWRMPLRLVGRLR